MKGMSERKKDTKQQKESQKIKNRQNDTPDGDQSWLLATIPSSCIGWQEAAPPPALSSAILMEDFRGEERELCTAINPDMQCRLLLNGDLYPIMFTHHIDILNNTGTAQESRHGNFDRLLSNWKSKLKLHVPLTSAIKTRLQSDEMKLLLDSMVHLESFWSTPERTPTLLGIRTNKSKKNRLSEFLYNISTYLQETSEQEDEAWNVLLYQFLQAPAESSPTLPLIKMQDFLISLRGSQNWGPLLSLMQGVFRSLGNNQNALQILGDNWEILNGLMDTLLQAFLSGTLTQTGASLQGILCTLTGHSNCGHLPLQVLRLLLPLESIIWKPLVKVQSGISVAPHGKFRPISMLSKKQANTSEFHPESAQEEVQNVLEIFYRSTEKDAENKHTNSEGPDDAVWEVLEVLRYSLVKRMERSAYSKLNRKVSHMTGTLMNRVSSVIGIPHSDENGKCSVGNLQQLLLWGIKQNISWNVQDLGFRSTGFPSAPPILTCSKPSWKMAAKSYNIAKKSRMEVLEEPQLYTDVLEAVCNDTIKGLPGVSNFTVFLYCNMYNTTGYSVDTTYDLQTACSDAAWYLSSMEEDSFWVWVCREYFPVEFNVTVCENTSFSRSSPDTSIMSDLCSDVYNSSEAVRELRNNFKCLSMSQEMSINPKSLRACLLENKTFVIEKFCSNDSLSDTPEDTKAWVSKLCQGQMMKAIVLNANYTACNYKTWKSNAFQNSTLVEDCKGINIQDFKDLVCRNASLYFALKPVHPWVADYCWKNVSLNGKCFLQRLADVLPLSQSFDSSQLCRNPVSYIIGLVSQLSQCDSESYGWALNVQYLLKMLDFFLTLSDSEQIGKETRDRLGEAILLTSLLDNNSFWSTFKKNASSSILQTVELYLEKENAHSNKEDLLSCFSPVLWELIQKEENATAFEILIQEYLQMPKEGFQKVIMSAENDAVERFLSLMHRSWPKIQVSRSDEKGLETMASMVIQKFPHLTPQIFVDLSQFIPFMSISDIVSFPLSLLANQSVLEAIRIHSPDMKINQKRAFAKRLLHGNMYGDISTWPLHFLRSIQPLLPYLPFCHFTQLSSDQIKLLADGWKDVNLGLLHGRYVAQSLMNQSQDADKTQSVQMLGRLICYLTYEDLQSFQPLHYPPRMLENKLLECIAEKTLSHRGRLAYSLVDLLKKANSHSLDINELMIWKSLLSELEVTFFQALSDSHAINLLTELQASDLSPAQGNALFSLFNKQECRYRWVQTAVRTAKGSLSLIPLWSFGITIFTDHPGNAFLLSIHATSKSNVAEQVLCRLHSLIPVLSPEYLRSLPTHLLTRACQCLGSSLPLLSPAQKAAIMQSLRKYIHDVELWPEQFSCLLPFAPLKLLHLDTQTLFRNMSLYGELDWMPQQTQYLWRKIQAGANLTKNTILTLGTLANGIECDNLQQLNSLSDIRDVVKYLQGIPSGLRKSLRKCILEEIEKRPELSFENTGWMGPEFITDLPQLIDRLPNDSLKLFLEYAHKYPKSFMELPTYKKSILAQRAVYALQISENGEISTEELDLLGPLVGFIREENIVRINRNDLLLHLDELKTYCVSEEFGRLLGKILVEDDMLGHPNRWTQKQVEQIGRLIFYLEPEILNFIPKEALGRNTLEWLLESQREWEESELGIICTRKNSHNQQRARMNKKVLSSALTKDGFRTHREPIPSCADMRVTFPSAWSESQINGMSLSDFEGCVNLIAEDKELSADQAKAALAKVKQLFGPAKHMSPEQILQIGHLITHMNDRDLHEIDTSDWTVVSFLGRMDNWTTKQMKALVLNILRQHKKRTSDLDLMEITALGHLLCGLGVEDLKQINIQEFSQAAVFVGSLKLKCSEAQLEAFAVLLTSSSAFGVVSRWGPEIFTEIGTLAAGLPDIVLSSLVRDQIQGLTPDAISLITPPKFAVVFSPAQLSFFTSDQAGAVTPKQYEHLNNQQRQAISSAQYEGDVHQDPREKCAMVLENDPGEVIEIKGPLVGYLYMLPKIHKVVNHGRPTSLELVHQLKTSEVGWLHPGHY
ncbi:stereocilin [Gastrophryne carolinensis]